jgi:hypothetical protein
VLTMLRGVIVRGVADRVVSRENRAEVFNFYFRFLQNTFLEKHISGGFGYGPVWTSLRCAMHSVVVRTGH